MPDYIIIEKVLEKCGTESNTITSTKLNITTLIKIKEMPNRSFNPFLPNENASSFLFELS